MKQKPIKSWINGRARPVGRITVGRISGKKQSRPLA